MLTARCPNQFHANGRVRWPNTPLNDEFQQPVCPRSSQAKELDCKTRQENRSAGQGMRISFRLTKMNQIDPP